MTDIDDVLERLDRITAELEALNATLSSILGLMILKD